MIKTKDLQEEKSKNKTVSNQKNKFDWLNDTLISTTALDWIVYGTLET